MTTATKRPLKYFWQFSQYALHCPNEDGKITVFTLDWAASNKAFRDGVVVATCTECKTRYEAKSNYDATTNPAGGYDLSPMTREVC